MKIYGLTPVGKNVARSVNAPDTANWRVIHYLDQTKTSTIDQITFATGLNEQQASNALLLLKRKGLVAEI